MSLSEDETQRLKLEFEAGPKSFLGTTLAGSWDSDAFERLCVLLRSACLTCEVEDSVAKWMAAGFYMIDVNLDRYVPPSLGLELHFTEEVKEHLMFLSCWFFSGVCPFKSPQRLEIELEELLEKAPDR